MFTVATILGLLVSLFTVLSVWNGALAATGLSEFKPDGSPGLGERYHTFAQIVWFALAVIFTIATYIIVFATGLA